MKKYFKKVNILLFATAIFIFTAAKTVGNGDWTDLGYVEGGWAGLYTSWTDLDSASNSYSAWTTKFSKFDGNTISMSYYYNAGANDSIRIIIQQKMGDNLIVNMDSSAIITGASTPVAGAVLLTPSSYGKQVRICIQNTGSVDNADGNDLELGFYSPGNDVINDRKSATEKWPGGSYTEPRTDY